MRPVVVAASLLLASPAAAFTVKNTSKGAVVHWPERAVAFVVASTGDKALDDRLASSAKKAISSWNASGQVSVSVSGPVQGAKVGAEAGQGNVIAWANKVWDADDEETLAITFIHVRSETGEVIDADIVVNDKNHRWTDMDEGKLPNTFDLPNTLTHEMGHALGLGHSDVLPATMYASSQQLEVAKRDLEPDDVQAVTSAYRSVPELSAAPALAVNEEAPGGGCQSVAGAPSWTALGLLCLLARGLRRPAPRA